MKGRGGVYQTLVGSTGAFVVGVGVSCAAPPPRPCASVGGNKNNVNGIVKAWNFILCLCSRSCGRERGREGERNWGGVYLQIRG